MYPKIEINLDGIIQNAKAMQRLCQSRGIQLSLVTKCLVSDKVIVRALCENGISSICEARIQNFADYEDIDAEKWLIREPMLCEIKDVIKYCDISLNSELDTLKALNEEAKKQGLIHKVVLMYELGDLREGANEKELEFLAKSCLEMNNIELYGIGVNLSCYGSVMPDERNMCELSHVAFSLEEKLGIKLKVISGGNSTSFDMLKEGILPPRINNLRIGEAVFLGNVPCIEKPIEEFCRSNFIFKAQIVEIKEKPSKPYGTIGLANSFGEAPPEFEDKGIRKRALISIGKQDININGLTPFDENIEILDGSSDYVLLDITDSRHCYCVGDEVRFKINYSVLLGAMNSRYVHKEYI